MIEDFAPTLDIHKPAGKFAAVQKRRYKLRYHVDDKYNPTTVVNTYVRSGIRNEWTLVPSGGGTTCPAPMTRAALLALRNSGGLSKDCHYVITNPAANGTLTAQSIILHAVDANTLSMQAGIKTSHDNTAWQGVYDIDVDRVLEVTDNLENKVISNASIVNFPFGVATVNGNTVLSRANLIYTAGTFVNNTIDSDATVTLVAGLAVRNHFKSLSNTTVNSGDFRDNEVGQDATVISSTTGDIDFNVFGNLSNSTFSGASSFDNSVVNTDANVTMTGGTVISCKFEQASNYIMSGGVLRESTVGQDADVTIISADNYENVFGTSTIYRQVGTGYIRYSTIEGTTTWTNGNTHVSNVNSYVSTVNTTGSNGNISNSTFHRAFCTNMQNIPSLNIIGSTISNYGQVTANGAARFYFYRSSITNNARILISAGSRIDANYTHVSNGSYIQSNQSGGFLTCNYTTVSDNSYVRNTTTNSNAVSQCTVDSASNMRFDGNASGGRIYYSKTSSGGTIYQTTNSLNCYMYYCTADSVARIYSDNSTNARMYYNHADCNGEISSIGCNVTHYIYYCNASRGYIRTRNNTALTRLYSIDVTSQAIFELRNTAVVANLYYSSFDSYYYAYVTFTTTGTRLGFFGKGRFTNTVTNPVLQGIGNLNNQTYLDNF